MLNKVIKIYTFYVVSSNHVKVPKINRSLTTIRKNMRCIGEY